MRRGTGLRLLRLPAADLGHRKADRVTSWRRQRWWQGYDARVATGPQPEVGSSEGVGYVDENAAFDAALERVRECVARIHALMPELQAAIERRARPQPRRRKKPIRIVEGRGP